jgi:hypothetical protein
MFGSKNEEIEEMRKLHNEGTHNVYSSANITLLIELKRITWVGHVILMEMRNTHKIITMKSK